MKHLHILGLSGTFMSGLAILAREAGYKVTGSDHACYPPVSDLLKSKGIDWVEGYDDSALALAADTVIVGNAIKRGMPVIEAVMAEGKPYTSGPQWLAEHILKDYQVLAVAGTHGKTTTTTMLAWILDQVGMAPGFLIGGVAPAFQTSARLGTGKCFVIEADEYDSAFFDKRPKFMHYRPQIAILNNLEFDHADIYPDLEAIKTQFHYLLRTIPSQGKVFYPEDSESLVEVIARGLYSKQEQFSLSNPKAEWYAKLEDAAGQSFTVYHKGEPCGHLHWSLMGDFNVENALAAIAASHALGVSPVAACDALQNFQPVKRRLEQRGRVHGVTVLDDFAHHPTAIEKTLRAVKSSGQYQRVLAILEFASYTMKQGVHAAKMRSALASADKLFILKPEQFVLDEEDFPQDCQILADTSDIIDAVIKEARPGDALLVMSNRGFDNIHERLLERLAYIQR